VAWLKQLGARLKQLFEDYGLLAVLLHFVIFIVVMAGIAAGIRFFGFHPESTAASAGVWVAAYAIAKATTFVRIPITLAITPLVAGLLRKTPAGVRLLEKLRDLMKDPRATPPAP
jgi:hypothetical protein